MTSFFNSLNFHDTTSPLKLLRFRAKFVILFYFVVYNYCNLHPNLKKKKKKKGKTHQNYSLKIREHDLRDP